MAGWGARTWPIVDVSHHLDADDVDVLGRGWLLVGSAGTGKTTLARHLAAPEGTPRGPVVWIRGSTVLQQLPLGALAGLLADAPDADEDDDDDLSLDAVVRARRFLGAFGPEATIVIDDAPLVDDLSATVLADAAAANGPRLVLTAREGRALPSVLHHLVAEGELERCDVRPLSEARHDDLVAAALGGPVHPSLTGALYHRTEGNPLFLRLLIESLGRQGSFEQVGGLWQATRYLDPPAELAELVTSELRDLPFEANDLLERTAVLGSLPLALVAPDAPVSQLEAIGLLAVEIGPDGQAMVVLDHPLVADAVRARLPRSRAARLVADLGAHPAAGDLNPALRCQLTRARLDLGDSVDVAELVASARTGLLLGQLDLAERCARAASARRGDAEERVLLAQVLLRVGKFVEGAAVLEDLEGDPGLAGSRAAIARSRTQLIGLGLGDAARAEAELLRAMAGADADADQQLSELSQASLMLYAGRPVDAIARVRPVAAMSTTADRVPAMLVLAGAQVLAGLYDAAVESTRAVLDGGSLPPSTDPAGERRLAEFIAAIASLEQGTFDAADALRHAWADDQGTDTAAYRWLAPTALGRAALLAGRPRTALVWFVRAMECEHPPPPVLDEWLSGLRAVTLATIGERDAAGEAVDSASHTMPTDGIPMAHARRLVAEGRRRDARAHLRAAADRAEEHGLHMFEAWLRYEGVRFGDTRAATVVRLRELADAGGALARLRAAHASAFAEGDADELEGIAAELAELGAEALAADAYAQAALLADRAGLRRRSTALGHAARGLLEKCEGAISPALSELDRPADLTPREHEVARLAADGSSAKDIAAMLDISWRTVENLLYRVYAKLGVGNRDELAEWVNTTTGAVEDTGAA